MMVLDKRFVIDNLDNEYIRDILGVIEPFKITPSDQIDEVCNVLNKNWEQFNKQKCMIKRLENQNKELYRINGKLHRRLGDKISEEKNCGYCKHFQLDGMFGIWCDKGYNWTEIEYCSDWER